MSRSVKWAVSITFGLIIVFCASFIFFYNRAQRRQLQTSSNAPTEISRPLPEAHLIDVSDTKLEDQSLRRGKVILVFITPECPPCKTEAQFLETIVGIRNDVKFYGVISYGDKMTMLAAAEKIFPFKVFYDEGFLLAGNLGIHQVPVKVFLEDGVIKKNWGGATNNDQAKAAFVQWLKNLQ